MGGLESSQSGINREVESMVTHAGTQYIVCTLYIGQEVDGKMDTNAAKTICSELR